MKNSILNIYLYNEEEERYKLAHALVSDIDILPNVGDEIEIMDITQTKRTFFVKKRTFSANCTREGSKEAQIKSNGIIRLNGILDPYVDIYCSFV